MRHRSNNRYRECDKLINVKDGGKKWKKKERKKGREDCGRITYIINHIFYKLGHLCNIKWDLVWFSFYRNKSYILIIFCHGELKFENKICYSNTSEIEINNVDEICGGSSGGYRLVIRHRRTLQLCCVGNYGVTRILFQRSQMLSPPHYLSLSYLSISSFPFPFLSSSF